MRWIALFVFSTVLAASDIAGSSVRTVYVMPMTHGLDQYLANQLTREHVFEVVTDPKNADAVFTERLGEPLQYALEKLHPTPKPPEEKANEAASKPVDAPKLEASKPDAKAPDAPDADSKTAADKNVAGDVAKGDSKDAEDTDDADTDSKDTAHKSKHEKKLITEDNAPRPFLSGRDKGTVFLVDAKSRAVLWSVYEKPKKNSPDDMDHMAQRVVTRLKQDLAGK